MLLFTHFSVLFANNRMQFANSPHHRCSSHILNLIASRDTAAANSGFELSKAQSLCSCKNVVLYGIRHQKARHMYRPT
jgi:hypothetical protein